MMSLYIIFMCFLLLSSAEVMELLIQSSDLFVMQVEMDVYTALKKVHKYNSQKPFSVPSCFSSLFFSFSASAVDVSPAQPFVGRPHQAASCRRWCVAVQTQNRYIWATAWKRVFLFVFGLSGLLKWFRPTDLCEKEPFLDTEDGSPYCSVFKHIRLQYIINDLASARILERDNILPPGKN